MPKQILFVDTIVSTVTSVSSENSNYPKENLIVPESPYDYWKTTANNTDQWSVLDLGAPTTITGVALFNTNYTNYLVQGSDSSTFASVPVDSGTITMIQDPERLRYNNFQNPQTYGTPFYNRYLRIFIPAQATTDSSSIFKTGGVSLSSGVNELIFNPDIGFNVTITRNANQITKAGGGAPEVRIRGERYASIAFSTRRYATSIPQMEEIAAKLISIDEGDTVVFYDNGEWQTYPTNSPYLYCCKRVGTPTKSHNSAKIVDISGINFIECL